MGPRRSNALRKEDFMETATPTLEPATKREQIALPRCGPERESATRPALHRVQLVMQSILQHFRDWRNLGPLSVLLLVVIYSLLSPYLPAPIHDYIYHIAH